MKRIWPDRHILRIWLYCYCFSFRARVECVENSCRCDPQFLGDMKLPIANVYEVFMRWSWESRGKAFNRILIRALSLNQPWNDVRYTRAIFQIRSRFYSVVRERNCGPDRPNAISWEMIWKAARASITLMADGLLIRWSAMLLVWLSFKLMLKLLRTLTRHECCCCCRLACCWLAIVADLLLLVMRQECRVDETTSWYEGGFMADDLEVEKCWKKKKCDWRMKT